MLIDSHCHLHDAAFAGEVERVLERARQAGVERVITIGTDLAESKAAIALAEAHPNVYATVGVAPHDNSPFSVETVHTLRELAQHPKVVALGEFGLDYHYNTWPRETQRDVFTQQLTLAAELNMPVVIHNRDADEDMLAILADFAARQTSRVGRGVMHCFSSTLVMAQQCAELGFMISIAGPLTYPKPRALPDIVRVLPLDVLLVETDAPYLAPHGYRGKRNEPAFVRVVVEKVAEIRAESFEHIAQETTRNAERLFGLGNASTPD
jgi:TatD DNase family protein